MSISLENGKNTLVWSGLPGRKQAAGLVAILMEKGGSRAGGGKRGEARPTRQHTRLGGGGRH